MFAPVNSFFSQLSKIVFWIENRLCIIKQSFGRRFQAFTTIHQKFNAKLKELTTGLQKLTTKPRELTTSLQKFTTKPQEFLTSLQKFITKPQEFTTSLQELTTRPSFLLKGRVTKDFTRNAISLYCISKPLNTNLWKDL
jgi:hypothetical protein